MPLDCTTLAPFSSWEARLADRIEYWRGVIPTLARPQATIDFETRSACGLKKHGSWVYSKHETTEAMCLAYRLPGGDVELWHMAHPEHLIGESPLPTELFAFVLAGGLVEAHNAFFERVIWRNVMVARHGWPAVPHTSWRCSASRASACSLPRDLENASKAMGLGVEKDMAGRRLMLKMSRPRQPRKDEVLAWMEENGHTGDYRRFKARMAEEVLLWSCEEEDLYHLWSYCKQDVRTEEAFSERVPELSPVELAVWQADQALNERGARFDLELAHAALTLAAEWRRVLNRELEEMTGISAATKRAQVKEWLEKEEGLELPDTAADTVDWYLERGGDDMSGRCRRVLEIMKQVNRTSTRKYEAMIAKTDPEDERARDLLMYHGAGTGRWSGKGIQVQNFPRGTIKDMEEACADILDAYHDAVDGRTDWETSLSWLYAMYGDVMELLSSALRGAVVSSRNRDLIVADYSAIEARCVLWEAGAEAALDVFRSGGDIYCDMATGIYGFQVDKRQHPNERQFGKQAILGLGYGMGFITFLLTCRKYAITFSVEQVRRILKDKYAKYNDWVHEYLFPKPKDGEDGTKWANRKRQAAQVRRKLEDAREDPRRIVHELALMKYTVDVYRSRYPEVKQMWSDQEAAAMAAVRGWENLVKQRAQEESPDVQERLMPRGLAGLWNDLKTPFGTAWRDRIDGPVHRAGLISWYVSGGFLCCELPSGRVVRYRDPHIKPSKTSWGETKDGLRYMSVVTGGKWARTSTYGGKLVENITQAVARDVMAEALLRSKGYQGYRVEGNVIHVEWGEPSPYDVTMSVHDELVAEVDEDKGSLEDFEDLMSKTEPWAAGCPITAEAARFKRYRK